MKVRKVTNYKEFVPQLVAQLTSDEFIEEVREKITECRTQTNNTYEYYGSETWTPGRKLT